MDRFVLYAALYHPDMHEELGINAHIAVVDFTAPAAMDGAGAKERARAELLLDTIEPPLSPRSRESLRRSRYCPPRSIVGGYSDRDWTPSTLATGT